MDIATVGGIAAAFVFLALGVIFARGDFALFFDPPSIMVTVLGSLSGLLASNNLGYLLGLGGGCPMGLLCFRDECKGDDHYPGLLF